MTWATMVGCTPAVENVLCGGPVILLLENPDSGVFEVVAEINVTPILPNRDKVDQLEKDLIDQSSLSSTET